MAHYAVAAGALLLVGARRREAAIFALFAAAPDLDVVTAVPWALAAPHLGLDADALVLGANLLGHRGLSHTLVAAALAGGIVGAVTRRARPALLAALAWATHVGLDLLTPWPLAPFWPISSVEGRLPLVTTLDPVLATVATATVVALLAPILAGRLDAGGRLRGLLARVDPAWGPRLAAASLVVLALHPAWIGGVAAAQGAALGDTHSANLPRTVTVVEDGDGWTVTYRWAPFHDGEPRHVPERANRTATGNATQAMDAVACALPNLGPYGVVDEPALVARPGGEGILVEAHDVVRNATSSGPHMELIVVDGEIREASTTREGQSRGLDVQVPEPVLEAASCR